VDSSERWGEAASEFIRRYDHWLEMFARAEMPALSPLVREGDRVVSREGYPNEGWTGYVIEPQGDGYAVLAISNERLMNPVESLCGFFSAFELAGKYVIWNIGGRLRVRCRVKSLRLLWEPQSLETGCERCQSPSTRRVTNLLTIHRLT
jgi:hypothetical protein